MLYRQALPIYAPSLILPFIFFFWQIFFKLFCWNILWVKCKYGKANLTVWCDIAVRRELVLWGSTEEEKTSVMTACLFVGWRKTCLVWVLWDSWVVPTCATKLQSALCWALKLYQTSAFPPWLLSLFIWLKSLYDVLNWNKSFCSKGGDRNIISVLLCNGLLKLSILWKKN